MILVGDWFHQRHRGRPSTPEFRPHRATSGPAGTLQAGDRVDLTIGLRTALERSFRYRQRLAEENGQHASVLDAINAERELALKLVHGFLPGVTGEYRLAVKELSSGDGLQRSRVASWELRRLIEVCESPMQVALGFERPEPYNFQSPRAHHEDEVVDTFIERSNDIGQTYPVPHLNRFVCAVVVNAVLQNRRGAMAARSMPAYAERIGWVLLHELLGHATARVRGRREAHAPAGASPWAADYITSWLTRAMTPPPRVLVSNVDVPWNWDPDTGTHDPAGA